MMKTLGIIIPCFNESENLEENITKKLIPNLENIDLIHSKNKFIIFNQKIFYYKLNLLLPTLNWYGSTSCKLKNIKDIDNLRAIKNKKYPFFRLDTLFS